MMHWPLLSLWVPTVALIAWLTVIGYITIGFGMLVLAVGWRSLVRCAAVFGLLGYTAICAVMVTALRWQWPARWKSNCGIHAVTTLLDRGGYIVIRRSVYWRWGIHIMHADDLVGTVEEFEPTLRKRKRWMVPILMAGSIQSRELTDDQAIIPQNTNEGLSSHHLSTPITVSVESSR